MATITIPDELLADAGIPPAELQVEVACRLFEAGRLTFYQAALVAGLSRGDLKTALADRKIALYRPTEADLREDLAALEKHGV